MTQNFSFQIDLQDEAETILFAQQFANLVASSDLLEKDIMVYLQGDLGAGKSFFSRALIQTFLPGQRVKSPTYTLFESYETEQTKLLHFDLYRLFDAEELEFLGIRELLTPPYLALVEWPTKGEGILPEADILLRFEVDGMTRHLSVEAMNARVTPFVKNLTKQLGTKLDKKATIE